MFDFTLNDGINMANFFIDLAEVVWILFTIGAVGRIVYGTVNAIAKKRNG